MSADRDAGAGPFRPLRILQVIAVGYEVGGAETSVRALSDALREAGHEVRVVCSDRVVTDGQPFAEAVLPAIGGGPVARFLGHLWSQPAYRALRRVVREFRPDVIHNHAPSDMSASLLWAARDVPTVMTVHGPEDFTLELLPWQINSRYYRGHSFARADLTPVGQARYWHLRLVQRPLIRAGFRNVDAFVAPSRFVADLLRSDVDDARIHQIHNGVALPAPAPPSAAPTVLFVGRLERVKGVEWLVRSMVSVVERIPDARLVIVGTGSDEARIAGIVAESGLGANIEMSGWLSGERLRRRFVEAAVVVAPSLWPEILGMVVIEAMGTARPVVGSRSGGIPELIEDGVTGFLVQPEDRAGMSDAIVALLTDPERAAAFGAAARTSAERFGIAAFSRRLEELYAEVIERRAAAGRT